MFLGPALARRDYPQEPRPSALVVSLVRTSDGDVLKDHDLGFKCVGRSRFRSEFGKPAKGRNLRLWPPWWPLCSRRPLWTFWALDIGPTLVVIDVVSQGCFSLGSRAGGGSSPALDRAKIVRHLHIPSSSGDIKSSSLLLRIKSLCFHPSISQPKIFAASNTDCPAEFLITAKRLITGTVASAPEHQGQRKPARLVGRRAASAPRIDGNLLPLYGDISRVILASLTKG